MLVEIFCVKQEAIVLGSFRESRENHKKEVSAIYSGNKQNEEGEREAEDWPSHLNLLAEGIHHTI